MSHLKKVRGKSSEKYGATYHLERFVKVKGLPEVEVIGKLIEIPEPLHPGEVRWKVWFGGPYQYKFIGYYEELNAACSDLDKLRAAQDLIDEFLEAGRLGRTHR